MYGVLIKTLGGKTLLYCCYYFYWLKVFLWIFIDNIWVATQRKEPYVGKIQIEFCIAYSRGYFAGHFGTKIMYLAQLWTELLQILSFKTCIMKN